MSTPKDIHAGVVAWRVDHQSALGHGTIKGNWRDGCPSDDDVSEIEEFTPSAVIHYAYAAPQPQQIAEPASQWPDNSCTDQYGNIRVCIGDEVENDDARFFIGAINDSQKLCVLDKSKPWELKNEKTPMAGCIRQGNYATSAITLRRITTPKEPS